MFKIITFSIGFLSIFIASSVARAGSDIDYYNGTVIVETDEHDDIIIVRQEGDYLVIRIFQMDEWMFDSAMEMNNFYVEGKYSSPSFEAWLEVLENLADNDRSWRRDIEDVHRVAIYSRAGNDCLDNDYNHIDVYAYGGEDGDYLSSIGTRNFLYGQNGDDILWISQATGPGYLSGGSGDDDLFGGPYGDRIFGGNGDDHVDGLAGDDDIYGGHGLDILKGNYGDDYIDGGYDGSIDILRGGDGHDEVVKYYFRYVSNRWSRNKDLIEYLEIEDTSDECEILSAIEK